MDKADEHGGPDGDEVGNAGKLGPFDYIRNDRDSESERDDARQEPTRLLNDAAAVLEPDQMRAMAGTLLRIADAINQNWRPENVKSVFRWPSNAHRIERNSAILAVRAKTILRFRHERSKSIPMEILGEPGWDMLLELFCQFAGGAAVSSKSLTLVSGVPQTTALRCLERLEAEGLIARKQSATDRRVTLFELTKKGVAAVGSALEKCTSASG